MTITNGENSLYIEVGALGEETHETVIPNGEKWTITEWVASAAYLNDAHVALVWDYGGAGETILQATHGDMRMNPGTALTGDGSKVLAISIVNDTLAARVMGGSYRYRKVA